MEPVPPTRSVGLHHNDHLGGVNVITDINGAKVQLNEYDPWGKVSRTEGNVDPEKRFTGQILDPESGLYYYGARYYDPELVRFISPDPIVPSPGDPQTLNRYGYVRNNRGYMSPFYRVKTTLQGRFADPARGAAEVDSIRPHLSSRPQSCPRHRRPRSLWTEKGERTFLESGKEDAGLWRPEILLTVGDSARWIAPLPSEQRRLI